MRITVKRSGGPNLVIQITNDSNKNCNSSENSVHANNVLSQLLKAVTVSEDKKSTEKKAGEKVDGAAGSDKLAVKGTDDTNLTPLMKAAKKDGNLVRKEIIQLKKRNNRNDGGDVAMLEKLLNEVEKEESEDDIPSGEKSNPSPSAKASKTAETSNSAGLSPKRINSDSGGWAAVHFACDNANHEGLRYLLEAGANPNLTDRMGATPLHLIILAAGRYPLEKKLLNGGSAASVFDKETNKTFGNFGNRPALPGVVKTKSGAPVKDNGYEYLKDFIKCAKLLLDNSRFELMKNERNEDAYNASKPALSSRTGRFDPILNSLPKDDGFGISPLCLCVCQGYTGRDALYPLLELLLTRGFDPNAKLCGFSALQIALRNMHYGCAFALTR